MAEHTRRKRRNLLPAIIALLAVAAIALVVVGRILGPTTVSEPGWQDAIYSVLLAFTLDGTFLGQQNIVTLLGAFAAALVFYLALFGSLWVVFRRRWRAWRASKLRDHIVIVGDGPDAEELAEALSENTNVVLCDDSSVHAPRLIGIEPITACAPSFSLRRRTVTRSSRRSASKQSLSAPRWMTSTPSSSVLMPPP